MKLDIRDFARHVHNMTDEEVRASQKKAHELTRGLDEVGKIFYFNFETEHGLSKEGYVQASGIEDVVNYISFLAGGAFVPSFNVRPINENEKVSLENLKKI